MFTGLIETIGVISQQRKLADGMTFTIDCRFESGPYQLGESIATDGICITVESFNENGFTFTASEETLKRGTFNYYKIGDRVHLERALQLGGRLGGHLVQGHVDGVGRVVRFQPLTTGAILTIEVPDELRKYIVEKGSLAVQGVSLTIAKIQARQVELALIPATLKETLLGELKSRDKVNLEVDIIAKYVESFVNPKAGGLDSEKLASWGF